MKDLPLLFHTARELCSHVKSLPSGPQWTCRVISTDHETKDPVCLYYCDALDCVKLLFNHPLFADKIEILPYWLFTSAERNMRVYTEWMSSDSTWELQVSTGHRMLIFCNQPFNYRKRFPLVAHYVVSSCHWIKPIL